jgi:hypothetical protein
MGAFASTGVVFILNHELGHFTSASIAGAKNPRFGLYRSKPEGGAQIGWTDFEGHLSGAGQDAMLLGGVAFSRLLAEGTDLLVRNVRMPSAAQPFGAALFLLGRFDFARYVAFDMLHWALGTDGSDIDQFVKHVAGPNDGIRFATYAALATLATFDLIWDWDRISTYGSVIGGDEYPYVKQIPVSLTLSPIRSREALGLEISLSW